MIAFLSPLHINFLRMWFLLVINIFVFLLFYFKFFFAFFSLIYSLSLSSSLSFHVFCKFFFFLLQYFFGLFPSTWKILLTTTNNIIRTNFLSFVCNIAAIANSHLPYSFSFLLFFRIQLFFALFFSPCFDSVTWFLVGVFAVSLSYCVFIF